MQIIRKSRRQYGGMASSHLDQRGGHCQIGRRLHSWICLPFPLCMVWAVETANSTKHVAWRSTKLEGYTHSYRRRLRIPPAVCSVDGIACKDRDREGGYGSVCSINYRGPDDISFSTLQILFIQPSSIASNDLPSFFFPFPLLHHEMRNIVDGIPLVTCHLSVPLSEGTGTPEIPSALSKFGREITTVY